MTIYFKNTDEAAAFVATSDSRETSVEIMRAIAEIARSVEEAENIWESVDDRELVAIVEIATGNGREDTRDFCWGASGSRWADGNG